MTPRPLMIATLLGASVGVPYVVSHQTGGSAAPAASTVAPTHAAHAPNASSSWWPASSPGATLTGVNAAAPAGHVNPAGPSPQLPTPQLESVRMHPVETVLRFDLTRNWVYRNWDRKSTGPTDVGLLAVRVALVSGRDIGSIAGALTYFFNDQGAIEHISFRGRTGDTTKLVDFLTRTYHFERVASPTGEQVYQVRSGDRVQSELRTRPEPVLSSASPHSAIAVELELARPGSQRYLPPRPTGLQIPQTAATAPPPTPAAAQGSEASAASSASADPTGITDSLKSTWDQARYATPQERDQMSWKRWPN